MKACIQIRAEDNVANVLEATCKDELLTVVGAKSGTALTAAEDLRRFHKIAVLDIAKGADIVRDGYIIGRAMSAIGSGEWVHIHNLESKRA
ncbi:MAG: D-galactarate dehydratase [Rhizobiaceae bacterium]|nr:D-galactarate dehydratase [Rhizobiaceae bacterium]